MTEQDMMKAVVEAVGECWHEFIKVNAFGQEKCTKCGAVNWQFLGAPFHVEFHGNHHGTDLNELFRLNKKLTHLPPSFGWRHSLGMVICTIGRHEGLGETESEALLNALYEAVK